MDDSSSRRTFLGTLAAGGALCGTSPSWCGSCRAAQADALAEHAAARQQAAAEYIARRARTHVSQSRLLVDYYRIGRKLSYPLPLTSLSVPDVVVPTIPDYPWATWMLWALEERINALGWAAEWIGDESARRAAVADLAALAQWPKYQQYAMPDLSSAHAARILSTAATAWQWVANDLRGSLHEACVRHVAQVLPDSDRLYGFVRSKEDVLRHHDPYELLRNIPVIGTIGAALTAAAARHPTATPLNARVKALFTATLELRRDGFSEGAGYDGYVLDFVADWLGTLSEADRSPILDHPNLKQYLEQSYMLGAPGAVERLAELSDVEPQQMPFHLSAQAKLLGLRRDSARSWLLARCPLDWLRSDALAALHRAADEPAAKAPPAGALDAHYATVLRSGWEADDLAVAIACSHSPMSHIQCDSGTLVAGTKGTWLIADPGYQQYAHGDERNFTIGPEAHNAPLINGSAQIKKQPRRLTLGDTGPGVHHAAIDLAACYPPALALRKLVRHVWLVGNRAVIVADQIEAETPPQATYHWHAHPACAWWFEANWAMVTLNDVHLWLTCPNRQLSGANLHRLPGSRGQLTLVSTLDAAGPVVWWAFILGARRPDLRVDADGQQLRLAGQTLRV